MLGRYGSARLPYHHIVATIAFRGDDWRVAVSDGDGQKADHDTDNIPFNDGNWHFLLATFDRDGDMTMYQDGVQVGSDNMADVGSLDLSLIHI